MTTLEEEKLNSTQPVFVWPSEHQKTFNTLKLALTTSPVLGYPNFNREFILETDASLRGLGAVLSQVDENGKVHVIAYASQTLRPPEKSMHNYSSTKLELLALKWAITEKNWGLFAGVKVYCLHRHLNFIGSASLPCLILTSFTDWAKPTRVLMP